MNKKKRFLEKLSCATEQEQIIKYDSLVSLLCIYLRLYDLEHGTNRFEIFNDLYSRNNASKYYYVIAQENYISIETLYNYISKINCIGEILHDNIDELSLYLWKIKL